MVDTAISGELAASTLTGAEVFPAVQSGGNVKATAAQIRTYAISGLTGVYQPIGAYLTANQAITLAGDATGSGTTAITVAISANKVTRAMLAQAGGVAILGATTAGNISDLTGTQVTAVLDNFSSTLKGLAPPSGGGTDNFLRADGSWAAPATTPPGSTTANPVTFDNSGSGAASGTTFDGSVARTISRNTLGAAASGSATASGLTMTTGKLLGRSTASTGAIEELSTVPAANFPALTGDVTTAGGALATTIAASSVTLAKMANMATASLIYRKTAGSGAPEVNTLATLKTDLTLVKADVGLGSVDNTADAAKAVLSATKLATARTINGVSFDGTANITLAPAAPTSQSGTAYTAVLADANTYIQFTNASAVTFTIPPNSSVAFPLGTEISMEQTGAGALSVAAGAGVTVNSRLADLTLAGQYAVAGLKKVATNTWTLTGDL